MQAQQMHVGFHEDPINNSHGVYSVRSHGVHFDAVMQS